MVAGRRDRPVEGAVDDRRLDPVAAAIPLGHAPADDVDRVRPPAALRAEVALDPGDQREVAPRPQGDAEGRVVVDRQVERQPAEPGEPRGDRDARVVHDDPEGPRAARLGLGQDLAGEPGGVERAVETDRAAAPPGRARAERHDVRPGGTGVGRRARGHPDDPLALLGAEQAPEDHRAAAAGVGRPVGQQRQGPVGRVPRQRRAGGFGHQGVGSVVPAARRVPHEATICRRISRSGTSTSQPG